MDFCKQINESGELTLEEYNALHKYEDLSKLIIAACKLKLQFIKPTRTSAIDALKSSLSVAYKEIRQNETACSTSYVFPQYVQFEQLTNEQLFSLLPIYFKGLEDHCINKFGKELYEKCLKIMWDSVVKNMD